MYSTYKYLFLDRDGVINEERPNDYVKNFSEFIFIDGVLEAICILSKVFEKIFIVTNQRGIGRKLYTEEDLFEIHEAMTEKMISMGGRIDKIYYATDLKSSSINRKPNIGMAFQILEDYPEVIFQKSIFVGNSLSDIQFGNKLGMKTVLVGDKYPKDHQIFKLADEYYINLSNFAHAVNKQTNEQNYF